MIIFPVQPHSHILSTQIYSKNFPQIVNYISENKFRRILRVNGIPYFIEAIFHDDTENSPVSLNCLLPETVEPIPEIVDCVQNILGLNFNLNEFYAILDSNPMTKSLRINLYGLKLMRSASLYEALIEAITEQQISFRAALTLRKRLATRYSEKIVYQEQEYYEFPPASVLVTTSIEELQLLGLSRNKAGAILSISELETQGILPELCNCSVTEIFAELIRIKGIGKWSIEYAICRGLGRYDIYPSQDLILGMGIKKLFGDDKLKTNYDIQQFLSDYGKYSGYLAFYIIYSFLLSKEK